MNYQPRPGIVKTKICGSYVLIPSRAAYGACNTIQRLPLLWAATWDAICNGTPMEKSVEVHKILTKRSEEEVRARIERFCTELCRKGFLIEVPDPAEASADASAAVSAAAPQSAPSEVPPHTPVILNEVKNPSPVPPSPRHSEHSEESVLPSVPPQPVSAGRPDPRPPQPVSVGRTDPRPPHPETQEEP